jgi:hypothetical protein
MKYLVIKTSGGDTKAESFQQGLLEFRYTQRSDGRSPAQVVLGHPMRSMVPAHYRSFANEWQQTAEEADEKGAKLHLRQKENYDKSARPIEPLKVGPTSCHQEVEQDRQDHQDRQESRLARQAPVPLRLLEEQKISEVARQEDVLG